jgi:hypothetical protein
VKAIKSLLHLFIGGALLAVVAYFAAGLARNGNVWWHQFGGVGSPTANLATDAPRSATGGAGNADPIVSAANLQVYGVLSQKGGGAGGDDATASRDSRAASVFDHASALSTGAPNHFLHRRFSMKSSQVFKFEVPPHAIHPELRGTFRSVATGQSPVEVLLMNDEQFADLVNHKPESATFSFDASSRGAIDWVLTSPLVNRQTYYLVFRNSPEAPGPTIVDADFAINFE